jgi:quercetin dioxygenase-like cupin family protein
MTHAQSGKARTAKSKTNGVSTRQSSACKHSAVVASGKLPRIHVRSTDEPKIKWDAAFATYGGHGADQSSTIVYEIERGGHLGWHKDATEEMQYIISGAGELQTEEGNFPVGPGSVFVLPTNLRHDLATPARTRCGRWRSLHPQSPRLRQRDAAAEVAHPGHPQPRRLNP